MASVENEVRFTELVASAAAGRTPDAAAVRRVCQAAGRSPEAFASAVIDEQARKHAARRAGEAVQAAARGEYFGF